MSARKDDKGKPPISLIPRSALLAEARVLAKGKERYGAHNWREGGIAWSRLLDAAMRHIAAFTDGEDFDNGPEGSKELHLANARCCLGFLIEYYEKGLGQDDRYKPEAKPKKTSPQHEYKEYEILALDFQGRETKIERVWTEEFAKKRIDALRNEWPTFLLTYQEVDDGHTETA